MKILKQFNLIIFNLIILYSLFNVFELKNFQISVYYLIDFALFTIISIKVIGQYLEDSLFNGQYTEEKFKDLEKKLLEFFL